MPEAYIRGNTIKYLRVPDEVIDKVRDDSYNRAGITRAAQQQLNTSSCTKAEDAAWSWYIPSACRILIRNRSCQLTKLSC